MGNAESVIAKYIDGTGNSFAMADYEVQGFGGDPIRIPTRYPKAMIEILPGLRGGKRSEEATKRNPLGKTVQCLGPQFFRKKRLA